MTHENPGCYGLPVAVNANSKSCLECAVKVACVGLAFSFVQSLPESVTSSRERRSISITLDAFRGTPLQSSGADPSVLVSTTTRGVKRIRIAEQEKERFNQLPSRVATQVLRLSELGWFNFARGEINVGRNPGKGGWKFSFCSALIDGGVTRQQLELKVSSENKISPRAAQTQVSVGLAIFAAGGLASIRDRVFTVLPFNPIEN